MKKPHKLILVVSLSAFIALFLLVISTKIIFQAIAFSGGGLGTQISPFQITSCEGLQEISDDLTAHYLLINDIDCTGVEWTPIGANPGVPFVGTLDGDGNTVSNISITPIGGGVFVGFFGSIDGGTVKNLNITNIQIAATNFAMVGGLAGEMGLANSADSVVTNVHITGIISGNTEVGGLIGNAYRATDSISYSTTDVDITGGSNTGGLIGMNYADVDYCSSAGTITSTGDYAGGLIGYSVVSSGSEPVGDVSNSFSSVDVESTGGRVGGLLGGTSMRVVASYATGSVEASGGEIGGLIGVVFDDSTYGTTDDMEELYATGDVVGDGTAVGGLIGSMYAPDISYSYATGSVTGYNGYVGGLIGYGNYSGTIDHCYAMGNVHGENVSSNGMTGGLVGDGQYITNSYATGNVTGNMDYVGGLAGILYQDVSNSYATGNVISNGDYAGGLIGGAYGSVNSCHATGDVSNTGDDNEGFGGLLGSAYGDVVNNSYAEGDVSVSGTGGTSMYAGGLIGEAYVSTEANDNYAKGNVTAAGLKNVGGLIGYIPVGVVARSYALGDVSGYDNVGGLIGLRYTDETVNTYALGSVTATGIAGGLIGTTASNVTNSYAKGLVSGAITGGLVGKIEDESSPVFTSVYYNSQTSGQSDTGKGISISSTQMATQSTYTGWDFDTIWTLGFALDTSISPSDGGAVSVSGNFLNIPTFQNQTKSVTLTATPSSGWYSFVNWTENGSVLSTSSTYTFNYTSSEINEGGEQCYIERDFSTSHPLPCEENEAGYDNGYGVTLCADIISISCSQGESIGARNIIANFHSSYVAPVVENNGETQQQEENNNSDTEAEDEIVVDEPVVAEPVDQPESPPQQETLLDELIGNNQNDDTDRVTLKDTIAVLATSITNLGKQINHAIKELPISEDVSQEISAVSLAVVVISPAVSVGIGSSYAMAYMMRFFSIFLALLGLGRKKRNCGLVYDSVTKEPLANAIVRIYSPEGTLVATEITNIYGIFESSIESGQYNIVVQANNYSFPSKLISGTQDFPYNNIYNGGNFSYDSSSVLSYSIPVDQVNKSMTEYAAAIARNRIVKWSSIVINILVLAGLAFSVISYVKLNSLINLILLIVYIVILLIGMMMKRQEKYKFGIVTDFMGEPKKGVQIGLLETEFNTVYAKRITNEKGKYRFMVPGGNYRLVSLDSYYDLKSGDEAIFNGKGRKMMVISENIGIVKGFKHSTSPVL